MHNALARKPKRIRTAFSPSQLLRLEHAFEKNHYVVGAERKQLAHSLSLTETQVRGKQGAGSWESESTGVCLGKPTRPARRCGQKYGQILGVFRPPDPSRLGRSEGSPLAWVLKNPRLFVRGIACAGDRRGARGTVWVSPESPGRSPGRGGKGSGEICDLQMKGRPGHFSAGLGRPSEVVGC